MPPRRKERSLDPYFTKSGQGKLFYEPADGPQQAAQREERSRRRGFERAMEPITGVEAYPDPPEHREKLRSRLQADEPRDTGGLALSQFHDFRGAGDKHAQRWNLGRGAGLQPDELIHRQQQFGHTPERFDTPGHWGATPPSDRFKDAGDALEIEAQRRSLEGVRRRKVGDLARGMATETTVPVEDLEGVAKIGIERHKVSGMENAAGSYWGREGGQEAYIQLEPGVGDTAKTLTHELGHHKSTRTPGYGERQSVQARGPVHDRQVPREEAFADDYAVRHGKRASYEAGARSEALGRGEDAPAFAKEYLGARQEPLYRSTAADSLSPQEFEHRELFETEPAYSPEADVEVQSYTRKRGAEVLGWGPNRYGGVGSIQKHEYDPSGESEFWGANYVSMFNADVVPDRRMEDYQAAKHSWPREPERAPKQLWRDR